MSRPLNPVERHILGMFKKRPNFCIKALFYNILCLVPFKVVPSTGDTPFPTFLPLLECFLERTFCDGAQFSYRVFLNLRVFKKRPNFLNSSPTSTKGALLLLSAPSGRFSESNCLFWVALFVSESRYLFWVTLFVWVMLFVSESRYLFLRHVICFWVLLFVSESRYLFLSHIIYFSHIIGF
jgi:hypothetical protein